MVIFPFEVDFFRRQGISDYVGNALIEVQPYMRTAVKKMCRQADLILLYYPGVERRR